MKIAIIGSRGIPNHYGGFEQFAEILSQNLVQKGHQITVYCSSNHPYKEQELNGVKLIRKFDPENKIGSFGQFIYDLLCMLDARKRDFDIIYMLGYTSSSIWQKIIFTKGAVVLTNMDGLEWLRTKYSPKVKHFLKYAEKLAVKYSDYLIADSVGIQTYLKRNYNVNSIYLPYGSYPFENPDKSQLEKLGLTQYSYDLVIARFEPENNIELILTAFFNSTTNRQIILIGDYNHTEFGNRMFSFYNTDQRIRFMGPIYDQSVLNNLRYFSNLYFHGHSVGGTNPSLLEAMGSSALICYHDNEFNHEIVGDDGFRFSDSHTLAQLINNSEKSNYPTYISNNKRKIATVYSWENICSQYEACFLKIMTAL
jgi:glycosyltransferase involved in cell wall biosynthesis